MTASRTTARPTGVLKATGRERDEWFAVLDRWGAVGRPYREIADYLTGKHGLSRWWAQKLIVEYEQARGVRKPGVRPGGTFTVTASKTVSAPVDQAFRAFTDARLRKRWLPGSKMRRRTAEQGRSARFDWDDGATRVGVTFLAKGGAKTEVGVEHELLATAKAAERIKVFWRERLTALKEQLEENA
ncbi:MAG TPA: hypothetical protein VG602_05120 [Actinomycetota bacterium]|nr:hypothetical protein [Actinomycetota bacterium]